MRNRSGEKIKLASIDELLGVVNEESEWKLKSAEYMHLKIILSKY